MLAYQHAYHAGNFADVHKHLALFALQQHILRKESSVTYVDTHAGRSHYPLSLAEMQKLGEYRQGVETLWSRRQGHAGRDEGLSDWLARLADYQPQPEHLSCYPGSPWWFLQALREHDRLALFELHSGEHAHLEAQTLPHNVSRRQADGLGGLRRMTPVATPRLCVLIDPSYERKRDYAEVADTLAFVARKVRHAIVLIWYPLLPAGRHKSLLDAVRRARLRKLWRSELQLHEPRKSHGMYGSGLLLFNPPWGFDDAFSTTMQTVATCLNDGGARHTSEWWVGE